MILADENIHYSLIKELRRLGSIVFAIIDTELRGISDIELIELANKRSMIIMTRDRDFLKKAIRRKVKTGLIYIAIAITKDNYREIAGLISRHLNRARNNLMIVYRDYVEIISLK